MLRRKLEGLIRVRVDTPRRCSCCTTITLFAARLDRTGHTIAVAGTCRRAIDAASRLHAVVLCVPHSSPRPLIARLCVWCGSLMSTGSSAFDQILELLSKVWVDPRSKWPRTARCALPLAPYCHAASSQSVCSELALALPVVPGAPSGFGRRLILEI